MLMQNIKFAGMAAKAKLRKFFSDEKGEVNIVAIVVLIGIAVILALAFKGAIKNVLDDLFGKINTSVSDINTNVQITPTPT